MPCMKKAVIIHGISLPERRNGGRVNDHRKVAVDVFEKNKDNKGMLNKKEQFPG